MYPRVRDNSRFDLLIDYLKQSSKRKKHSRQSTCQSETAMHFASVVVLALLGCALAADDLKPEASSYLGGYGYSPYSSYGYNSLGYGGLGYNSLGYGGLGGYGSLGYGGLGYNSLGYGGLGYGYGGLGYGYGSGLGTGLGSYNSYLRSYSPYSYSGLYK